MIARAGIVFLLAGMLALSAPAAGQTSSIEIETAVDQADVRLSEVLVRYSRLILQTNPLPLEGWEAAKHLLLEAARVDPSRDSAWRLLSDIAMEQDDTALLNHAIRRLIELDPADSSIRLTRLLVALDDATTGPAQVHMLEQLLDPAHVQALGPAVASALAMQASTLERQRGNSASATHWQDQAVALDSSNARAIAMDVGEDHADAVAWGRHLIALLKANPGDMETALRLGIHLLEHGDAVGAARFLSMSRDLSLTAGQDSGAALDADLAMALLLSGDEQAAAIVLEQRRLALDRMYQSMAESESTEDRSAVETARLQSPLTPKIAATLLLLASADGQDLTQPSMDLVEALQWNDLSSEQQGQHTSVRSRTPRIGFRIALAVGAPRAQLDEILELLNSMSVKTDFEEELLAAKDAHEAGRPEEAEAALRAMLDKDVAARILLADLLHAKGDLRSAALEYAVFHREAPGSFLGALSSLRLQAMLGGQRLPLESTAAELEALAEGLAPVWSRYGSESTLAVTMRLRPSTRSVGLFDPLIVNVQVFNHLEVPLAITATGPIKDLLVLKGDVQQPYRDVPSGRPIVIDIGRRLRLEPNQRMTIPVDLREFWFGDAVDHALLVGATVELDAVLNPRLATAPASGLAVPLPGPLGMTAASGIIHVAGKRVAVDDLDDMLQRLLSRETDRELKDMAVLAWLVTDNSVTELRKPLAADDRQRIKAALAEKWPRLSPAQQAWLVAVMPISEDLGELQELVDDSSESTVQQVLLIRLSQTIAPSQVLDDPRLARGLRSSDPAVYSVASFLEHYMILSAEEQLQSRQQ